MITKELDIKFTEFLKVLKNDEKTQDNAVIYIADELARMSDIRALWGDYLDFNCMLNEAYKMLYKDENKFNIILCATLRTIENYLSNYFDNRKKHFTYVKNKEILIRLKKSKNIIKKGLKD